MLLIITNTSDELHNGINIDDLCQRPEASWRRAGGSRDGIGMVESIYWAVACQTVTSCRAERMIGRYVLNGLA